MTTSRLMLPFVALSLLAIPTNSFAQHLETGTATFTESASGTDSTDNSGWVTVVFERTQP